MTKRLENKLVEKEQEIQDMHASMRDELEGELQHYYEQLSSLRTQVAEMNAAIEGQKSELLNQMKVLQEVRGGLNSILEAVTQDRPDRPLSRMGRVDVVHKEDDAIVMIRRR